MKKLFLIFLCTVSVNLVAFASSDGVFFGFNSWTHEELDDVGKIRTSSTTRILYDNCRYYVMPENDMLHLCVNKMRIYTMNQIDLKKTGQKLEVHKTSAIQKRVEYPTEHGLIGRRISVIKEIAAFIERSINSTK